jgi:hypothetical protein
MSKCKLSKNRSYQAALILTNSALIFSEGAGNFGFCGTDMDEDSG